MSELLLSEDRLQYLLWPVVADDGVEWHLYQDVEKGRQRRSRPVVVLTYSCVRSGRQRSCGLAGRAFLIILLIQSLFKKSFDVSLNRSLYFVRTWLGVDDTESIGFRTRKFTVSLPHSSVKG